MKTIHHKIKQENQHITKQDYMLVMKNVSKVFGEQKALKNITFHVDEGEVFGFLGPSGAGKTTAINLFTAQLVSSMGEVTVMGKDVVTHHEIFGDMGVLTDSSGLYERLSIMKNLMLFARFHGLGKNQVEEVLEEVDLIDHIDKPVDKLSKGMKQRVMIARAVIHKPKVLFLDEPTASLDPGTTLEIHKLIRKLNRNGTTVFLTTHDMTEADKLCDRVAFIDEGVIVDMDSPKELKKKYGTNTIDITLKDGSEYMLEKDGIGGARIKKWLEEGMLETVHSNEPSLEEIFLSLTGKELS